jgi:isopenicillin N synthase-like dioxygenase
VFNTFLTEIKKTTIEPHGVQNALCYERTPPKKWGVPGHYDNGFLTILMQDDAGGLQAMSKDEWFSIPPVEDTFVVNFGNMLEHISYGVVTATWHNVRNTSAPLRWSWPTFFGKWFFAIFNQNLINFLNRISSKNGRHEADSFGRV